MTSERDGKEKAPGVIEARRGSDRAAQGLVDYVAGTLEVLAPSSSAILLSRGGAKLVERYDQGPHPQDPAKPVGADSLWPYWSVTKSFAAALIARLVRRGDLDFGLPLARHLPEFAERGPGPFDRRKVLLRHLMSHSSGCSIPGRAEDGVNLGEAPDLTRVAIVTEPGLAFEYSSLGMHILERFLEAACGMDYEALLKREVLAPFGLESVRYLYEKDFLPEAGGPPAAAKTALPCLDGMIVLSQPRQRCGLGLYGTARDLLLFGQRWLSMADASGAPWCDARLREAFWAIHATRPSDSSDYGLLWWVFGDLNGYVASGASYTVCALLPRDGIVAVVARNHYGPTREPFDYRNDKRRILELAAAFR